MQREECCTLIQELITQVGLQAPWSKQVRANFHVK